MQPASDYPPQLVYTPRASSAARRIFGRSAPAAAAAAAARGQQAKLASSSSTSPRLACRILDAYPLSLTAASQAFCGVPHRQPARRGSGGGVDSHENDVDVDVAARDRESTGGIAFSASEVAEIVDAALREAGRRPMFNLSQQQQQQQPLDGHRGGSHTDDRDAAAAAATQHHVMRGMAPSAAAAAPHAASRLQRRFDGIFSRHAPALHEMDDKLADIDSIIRCVLDFQPAADGSEREEDLAERIEKRARLRVPQRPPSAARPAGRGRGAAAASSSSSAAAAAAAQSIAEAEERKLAAARAELGIGAAAAASAARSSGERGDSDADSMASGVRATPRSRSVKGKLARRSTVAGKSPSPSPATAGDAMLSPNEIRIGLNESSDAAAAAGADSKTAAPAVPSLLRRRAADNGSGVGGMAAYLTSPGASGLDAAGGDDDAARQRSPSAGSLNRTMNSQGRRLSSSSGAMGSSSVTNQLVAAKTQRLLAATSTAAQHLILYREALENQLTCRHCLGLISDPQIFVVCGHTHCRRCCEKMRVGFFGAAAGAADVAAAVRKKSGQSVRHFGDGKRSSSSSSSGSDSPTHDDVGGGNDDDDRVGAQPDAALRVQRSSGGAFAAARKLVSERKRQERRRAEADEDARQELQERVDVRDAHGEALDLFPERKKHAFGADGDVDDAYDELLQRNRGEQRAWYRCSTCKVLSGDDGFVPNHALAHIRARFNVCVRGTQPPERTLEQFADTVSKIQGTSGQTLG